jgi:hypothetical protein
VFAQTRDVKRELARKAGLAAWEASLEALRVELGVSREALEKLSEHLNKGATYEFEGHVSPFLPINFVST